ncbi:uncharacterized protein AMSG_07534 [Thecamonas trahens ATCC 50062]|uniref:Uncharacterized protein n=1 Tax=Thecamonas trahens ATCC 50062 TaxID=461836 RepID=A0A0L0DHP4_THETB|nr:hypothetical protein AMSG_07534 [Thecamonas trahens ATCC 50062]KNC51621.1 hypothetical protein AMSG_07534 [Thecamonas trahens ATCC 50062]|eukprot:XP_013756016.1 hypothetical protein AMSG_07534 [Thecamonas trahens ATCC 50062]
MSGTPSANRRTRSLKGRRRVATPTSNRQAVKFLTQRAKEREARREAKLAQLDHEQRELDFQYVQKVKEANDMLLTLAPTKQYRVFKAHARAELRIHLYQKDDLLKDLSIDRFRREYKRLLVEIERRESQARMGLSARSRAETAKQRRQATRQEMQSVLLDTTRLIGRLRDQLEELESKGGSFSPYIERR